MHHPFRNDASFLNCPTYFGQPEKGDHHVLFDYPGSCVSFIHSFDSVTLVRLPLLEYMRHARQRASPITCPRSEI
jgi:hypothetical protein